jgi:hypothetical protein
VFPFDTLHPGWNEVERNESALTHCTLLYNDEVHTYDDVINQLKLAVPHCTDPIAMQLATKIDGTFSAMTNNTRVR